LPLVLLAIPSVLIGFYTIEPMLFGDFFNNAIYVNSSLHPAMGSLQQAFHSPMGMAEHALTTWPFILALAGVLLAFYMYMVHPAVPAFIQQHVKPLHSLLVNKYFLDDFNEKILARGARWLATGLWKGGDQGLIDGWVVNGSWQMVGKVAMVARRLQTGFLYHYALLMILGMFGLITWFVWLKP